MSSESLPISSSSSSSSSNCKKANELVLEEAIVRSSIDTIDLITPKNSVIYLSKQLQMTYNQILKDIRNFYLMPTLCLEKDLWLIINIYGWKQFID